MSQLISALPVGSNVKYGTYKVEASTTLPIIWKVIDKNHAGYPADSVTLLTEKIIDLRGFDAQEPLNADSGRAAKGNGRYRTSNLRQWLNSSAAANVWWVAQNLTDGTLNTNNNDATPNDAGMSQSTGYNDIQGFLNNFTAQELAKILDTTLDVTENVITDGGGYETVVDKIFLLSNTEVGFTNENNIAEGSLFSIFATNANRIAYMTDQAFVNTLAGQKPANVSAAWQWWLRTSYTSNSYQTRLVLSTGTMDFYSAYYAHFSVRPALNLANDIWVTDVVDEDGCYTILEPPNLGTGSSETTVTTTTQGSWKKLGIGSSEAIVITTTQGSWKKLGTGSSQTQMFIVSEAAGVKLARAPPSEVGVVTSTEGSFAVVKSGSSQTGVTISQNGYYEKIGIDSSEVPIITSVKGSGSTLKQGSSEVPIITSVEGSSSAVRQGSSQVSIVVTSEGSGQSILGNGSMANIVVTTEGLESSVKLGESESQVSVVTNGSCATIKTNGSESQISVSPQGSGYTIKTAGSESHVSISAEGVFVATHPEFEQGGSYAYEYTQATGSGSTVKIGHSQINVFIVEQASGVKLVSDESTSIVDSNSVGYGRKVASGYSETTSSNVSVQGSGNHVALRNSQVMVTTGAQGTGYVIKNGQSQYFVKVLVTGQGVKLTSGSALASVVINTRGTAQKVALGSSNVNVSVLIQGNGERVVEVYSGGSDVLLNITTEASGLKETESASESVISIDTIGTWEAYREGSRDTHITVVAVGSGHGIQMPGIPVEIFLPKEEYVFIVPKDGVFYAVP